MKFSISKRLIRSFRKMNQWFFRTPERSLEQAYEAALMIKAIEDARYNGQKIGSSNPGYSARIQAQFKDDLRNNLRIAKIRLQEFRASRLVVGFSDLRLLRVDSPQAIDSPYSNTTEESNISLEKLQFIDEVLCRYDSPKPERPDTTSLIPIEDQQTNISMSYLKNRLRDEAPVFPTDETVDPINSKRAEKSMADQTSFVPRSILGTIDRLRRELDPKAEEEVVKTFRSSKTKTILSLKFILLLILIPLLVHQVSKSFVVGPVIDQMRAENPQEIFLNIDMEEEALDELRRFESRLEFESLLNNLPPLTEEARQEKVQDKAEEIALEYRDRSANAVKNVFADLCSVVTFIVILTRSKKELAILKSFIDEIIYGLSDSAKAFIIILFTDVFVGFHSPHGWEVILEGISRHLGLPESREFIFLFIATFPVILDTVFKYWIFRYLNRISPSAVATYRNMNE